jgi:hypothetical protein
MRFAIAVLALVARHAGCSTTARHILDADAIHGDLWEICQRSVLSIPKDRHSARKQMKTNIELPSPPRRCWRREARSAGAGQGREILPWGITALTEYTNYTIFFFTDSPRLLRCRLDNKRLNGR